MGLITGIEQKVVLFDSASMFINNLNKTIQDALKEGWALHMVTPIGNGVAVFVFSRQTVSGVGKATGV